MRVSPNKINISYQNHYQSTYAYEPKIIKSGYIIGEPIAFTNQPILPQQYQQFSAPSSRKRSQTQYQPYKSITRQYRAPQPTQFLHPRKLSPQHHIHLTQSYNHHQYEQTVSIEEYNNLKARYNDLEKKYTLLEIKYNEMNNRTVMFKNNNDSDRIDRDEFMRLVQKYKKNTLKQCNLLIDRARLQMKEQQLSSSR